jgi:hypothetical protein
MTDNVATLRGFTRYVLATSDACDLFLLIKPDTNLDSTFQAYDTDEQTWLNVNGRLFSIEDIEVRPMPEDYEPYNTLPEFDQGISDYMEGRYDNPYTDPRDGVKAQAHDRGSEYAMRVVRFSGSR